MPRDGGLALSVINQAEAIPAAHLERLFEPFVSGREGGSGLGLWVTYQIVSQLGGRIAVDCGHGEVRFAVWLPLERKA
jgi:nitrogen-specific signal transduction histidine kinase